MKQVSKTKIKPKTKTQPRERKLSTWKLSTLILQGVKRDGRKITGKFFALDKNGNIVGCCAMGAAAIAANKLVWDTWEYDGKKYYSVGVDQGFEDNYSGMVFPEEKTFLLPKTMRKHWLYERTSVLNIVTALNDQYRWSREKIAEMLKKAGL